MRFLCFVLVLIGTLTFIEYFDDNSSLQLTNSRNSSCNSVSTALYLNTVNNCQALVKVGKHSYLSLLCISTAATCCPSLQVQQCWTLPAGAFNAALLGMAGRTCPFLDCTQSHHHHWPGHQPLHHPRARLLLPNCH